MTKSFFITGTDTNIGKTTATVALMNYLQEHKSSVLGLKPIATGCFKNNNELYSEDALLLQKNSRLNPQYEHVNPFRFEQPVSPHLVNHNINSSTLSNICLQNIALYNPDYCLIEGAGGWLCPLNNNETLADMAYHLNIPIILVVGIKLGCLNHAMLSVESIINNKLKICGWIANCLIASNDVFITQSISDNILYLKNKISAPLIGTIDYFNISHDPKININPGLIL